MYDIRIRKHMTKSLVNIKIKNFNDVLLGLMVFFLQNFLKYIDLNGN